MEKGGWIWRDCSWMRSVLAGRFPALHPGKSPGAVRRNG
jgi:hypothetical protein